MTGFYFCENPVCKYKPIDLNNAELIDMYPLYSGVKIYKIQFWNDDTFLRQSPGAPLGWGGRKNDIKFQCLRYVWYF